jgi:exodeoxyribonuclease VII large subunit
MTTNEFENIIFTVSELSGFIKSIMPNKRIRIIGEVSQPSIRSGHMYFSLKDDLNNLKSIIWKSKNINRDEIIEGQKITIDAKLDFYGGSGSVNLIVEKLINNEGSGELFKKYEKIKQDFTNKGYFEKSRKKKLLPILQNILVITSETGAALQDFKINLENNKLNINLTIENVMVQGSECPRNICDLLTKLKNNNSNYDLVIITRGGGSFEDLFGFSQPELIESVYTFHLPILSAIGHQIDNPLLDLIADISTPTPSLAAQFIVDYNKTYLEKIKEVKDDVKLELLEQITNQQNLLSKLNDKIYQMFNSLIQLKNDCQNTIRQEINSHILKLSILESKLNINLINQPITLYHKNTKITKPDDLENYINLLLKLRWGEKEFKIKIMSTDKN